MGNFWAKLRGAIVWEGAPAGVELVGAGVELMEESEENVVGGLEEIVGPCVGLEGFSWVGLEEDRGQLMDFFLN